MEDLQNDILKILILVNSFLYFSYWGYFMTFGVKKNRPTLHTYIQVNSNESSGYPESAGLLEDHINSASKHVSHDGRHHIYLPTSTPIKNSNNNSSQSGTTLFSYKNPYLMTNSYQGNSTSSIPNYTYQQYQNQFNRPHASVPQTPTYVTVLPQQIFHIGYLDERKTSGSSLLSDFA